MPRSQRTHPDHIYSEAKRLVNKGYSIRKAAADLGLPYTTVQNHVNGKYKGYITTFGEERMLKPEDEQIIINYGTFMASRGCPLSRLSLRNVAREIIISRGGDKCMDPSKGLSDRWVTRFLKNHSELKLRVAHPLEHARAIITQDVVDEYFHLLVKCLNEGNLTFEPARIYNCDESGFSGKLNTSRKVIIPKGIRHAYQSYVNLSGHVTLLNAISAAGQTTPPMLIFSQCLPRGCDDGLPDSWQLRSTEKGFITSQLFVEWFEECFIPYIGTRRPVLLILDNHATHTSLAFVNLAAKHKVDILYLPAHSSHLLQPQDVGYFHILKHRVAELSLQLGYLGVRTLPRNLFGKILLQAFNQINGATVAAAFKCTGIYPFNKYAVKALLPSIKEKSKETFPQPSTSVAGQQESVSTENALVKLGIISADLAHILVEPPAPRKPSVTKRVTYKHARLIKSTDIIADHKTDQGPANTASEDSVEGDVDICVVCMMGDIEEYIWVGCDTCDKWYHRECLPSYIQTEVDLSLITGSRWMCRFCQEE